MPKDNFIEGSDYQMLRKNVECKNGAVSRMDTYKLTVPCMEYFVARKAPEIFEVYRRVFHAAVDNVENKVAGETQIPQATINMFKLALNVMKEHKSEIDALKVSNNEYCDTLTKHEDRLLALENGDKTREDDAPYSLKNFCDENNILMNKEDYPKRKGIGMSVTSYCRKANVKGFINNSPASNIYPAWVLKHAFRNYLKEPNVDNPATSPTAEEPKYLAIVQYADKHGIDVKKKDENILGQTVRGICTASQIPTNIGGKWISPSGIGVNTYPETIIREAFIKKKKVIIIKKNEKKWKI